MGQEVFTNSLLTEGEVIPVLELLRQNLLKGEIQQLQLLLSESEFTANELSQILAAVFKVPQANAVVELDIQHIHQRDHSFADEFGYLVKPLFVARARVSGLEVWAGPTLIRKDHPLADTKGRNPIYLSTSDTSRQQSPTLIPQPDIVAANYFRATVEEKPSVLANLCQKLANYRINICELRQPETRNGALTAEIAFLLDPSPQKDFQAAISSIRNLSVVMSVDSVFRVIGNPISDISRPYSRQS